MQSTQQVPKEQLARKQDIDTVGFSNHKLIDENMTPLRPET